MASCAKKTALAYVSCFGFFCRGFGLCFDWNFYLGYFGGSFGLKDEIFVEKLNVDF